MKRTEADYKLALERMIWWVNSPRENVECPPGAYVEIGEGTRQKPNRCGNYDYGSECCRRCWLRWAFAREKPRSARRG